MTPEVRAAVEGLATLGSGVVLMLLAASLVMMRNVSRTARCRWCEHCRRAEDDEKVHRDAIRHQSYHQFTDRAAASACQREDCPGRQ